MKLDYWDNQIERWMDIFSDYEPDLIGLELVRESDNITKKFYTIFDDDLNEIEPESHLDSISELAEDLSYWSAEIPGKVLARAEAITGPTTPPSKRVQTINPPGSEVGPGGVATWGKAITNEVKWEWNGRSSKHIPFEWSGP